MPEVRVGHDGEGRRGSVRLEGGVGLVRAPCEPERIEVCHLGQTFASELTFDRFAVDQPHSAGLDVDEPIAVEGEREAAATDPGHEHGC